MGRRLWWKQRSIGNTVLRSILDEIVKLQIDIFGGTRNACHLLAEFHCSLLPGTRNLSRKNSFKWEDRMEEFY